MGRFQTVFEIRKCLHKLSHIFARSGISRLSRVEISNDTRKETLDSPDNDKRDARCHVQYGARGDVSHLARTHLYRHALERIVRARQCDRDARAFAQRNESRDVPRSR